MRFELVARLAPYLQVWLSDANIRAGADWQKAIHESIANCDSFIVALSPSAVDSAWVKREVEMAFKRPNVSLVPVLLEKCAVERLHPRLPAIEHVDFRKPDSVAEFKLLDALGIKPLHPFPTPWPPSKHAIQDIKATYETLLLETAEATAIPRLLSRLCVAFLHENPAALLQFQRSDLWRQQPEDLRRECEKDPQRLIHMAVRLAMHELLPVALTSMQDSVPAPDVRFFVEVAVAWIPHLVHDNNFRLADALAEALWPLFDRWGDREQADWLLYRRYADGSRRQ